MSAQRSAGSPCKAPSNVPTVRSTGSSASSISSAAETSAARLKSGAENQCEHCPTSTTCSAAASRCHTTMSKYMPHATQLRRGAVRSCVRHWLVGTVLGRLQMM